MPSPNATFTEMVTTTLREHPSEIADNVSGNNALYRYMKKKGKIKKVSGGYEIIRPLDRDERRAREGLRRAAERMRAFYAATDRWLVRADHNHLRITRIVASLRDLLGQAEARAFRSAFGLAPSDYRRRKS